MSKVACNLLSHFLSLFFYDALCIKNCLINNFDQLLLYDVDYFFLLHLTKLRNGGGMSIFNFNNESAMEDLNNSINSSLNMIPKLKRMHTHAFMECSEKKEKIINQPMTEISGQTMFD